MVKSAVISDADVNAFQQDGTVCLRGAFTNWIDTLRAGRDRHLQQPSDSALTHQSDDLTGVFIEDFCCWERIPEYTDFVRNSPLGEIAARLMRSQSAQFFHDHLLHKEASSGVPTPWHQDMPFYCVSGTQTVSLWVPLDAREQQVSLRLAAGSHRLPKEIRPTSWSTNESFYADDSQFMDIPDVDNSDFEIREWAVEPGDAVAFDFRTLHGANANTRGNLSSTVSFRLVGDDATYRDRGARTSPNFPDINQTTGERLREDWFPVIFSMGSDSIEKRTRTHEY
ncbi:MAG: phytanoyl-CoA dioxygenase family protein [Pseudomonadota bacterium]